MSSLLFSPFPDYASTLFGKILVEKEANFVFANAAVHESWFPEPNGWQKYRQGVSQIARYAAAWRNQTGGVFVWIGASGVDPTKNVEYAYVTNDYYIQVMNHIAREVMDANGFHFVNVYEMSRYHGMRHDLHTSDRVHMPAKDHLYYRELSRMIWSVLSATKCKPPIAPRCPRVGAPEVRF